MARHYKINPDQREVALALANRALSVANSLSTARPGSLFVPNTDSEGFRDGTGTWIGSGAVGNGGVAQWVGDKTPPGRPTGVTATSAWGIVYVAWAGTLEGGVPADFDHVSVLVDGSEVAQMSRQGTVAVEGLAAGAGVTVTLVAYDDARARDGSPAPNASQPSDPVTVEVSDERSEIDQAVQDASDRADELQQEMSDITATVDGVGRDVTELASQVSGAVEKADQSLSVATEARQTVDSVSTTASRAYEDAQSALSQSSSALQTAQRLQTTVEEEYLSKDEASGSYASKSEVTQTRDDILSAVESEYQSKDGMSSYYTKTEVDQRDDAITSTVSTAQSTADSALSKASTVEQTAEGLTVRLDTAEGDIGDARSAADSASSAASAAQGAAEDAAKVATNYLGFSSSGLVVGDQTAGELGKNVLIDSDSVDVRDGTTVLASFGADLIELGKGSSRAVIALCGGEVRLSYASGSGLLVSDGITSQGSVSGSMLAASGALNVGGPIYLGEGQRAALRGVYAGTVVVTLSGGHATLLTRAQFTAIVGREPRATDVVLAANGDRAAYIGEPLGCAYNASTGTWYVGVPNSTSGPYRANYLIIATA